MDLTSSLHPMDSTLTGAALTSRSSLCPQGQTPGQAHTCGTEPEWAHSGAFSSSVLKLRGARGVNYHQQEGLPCRWLGIWMERGEKMGPAAIVVFLFGHLYLIAGV